MKVVLFCGGQGLRIREYNETVPKPMVPVGSRPILWHVMRLYAQHGFKDFILCLGHQAEVIKDYFLRYNEAISNDFVLSRGGRELKLLGSDMDDWQITFVDTGRNANVGERLVAVRPYLEDDEVFLANYADTLTDAPLDEFVETFTASDHVAAFMAIKPRYTFHVVEAEADGAVTSIEHVNQTPLRINGGYFVLRREVFDFIQPGEELVEEPFRRLLAQRRLMAFAYDGFWAPMDTLKDKQELDALMERGNPPWVRQRGRPDSR